MVGAGALENLARQVPELAHVALQPVVECRVIELVGQAAVELGEPGQCRLVVHHRQIALAAERRPAAQQRLHRQVECSTVLEFGAQPRQHRQIGDPALEEQLRQHAPVVGVIPDHLDRQHFRVAEQWILVDVQRQRAVVERMEHPVVDRGMGLPA